MRVVLDSNVIIAAFAARGMCADLLAVCLEQHRLVSSLHILVECRRHLVGKVRVPPEHADEIVAFLDELTEIVEPDPVDGSACRDPDDLPVLGTATAGRADVLVTGDRDLLDLGDHRGIPILSPRQAYERTLSRTPGARDDE